MKTSQRDTGKLRKTSTVPRSTSVAGMRVPEIIACAQSSASTTGWTQAMD